MQIILKPTFPPELGEIIVNDCLFAVGRHEPPFSTYDSKWTEKLSRRHARIFEQDGSVYLADLGSLNGTTVGGQRVGKMPWRLQRGDEICFAGLCYQIEILGAAASRAVEEHASPPLRLVLRPEHPRLSLEPIVVTEFPFLINKTSDVFARYKERLPNEVNYISRRHAHIFLRNNELYIEDLGSTNGTYVGGARLGEHAHRLQDGERVAFGGDQFVYRVELLHEGAAKTQAAAGDGPSTAVPQTPDDITRTTFVTSANSFLEIFCCEEDADKEEPPAPGPEAVSETASRPDPQAVRGWRGLLRRSGWVMRQIKDTLAEDPRERSRRRWVALAAVLALAAVAAGVYWSSAPERDIRSRMEQGAYREAAAQADRYLGEHPDDRDIASLATEALVKAMVPGWMQRVEAGTFADAEQQIDQGRALSQSNPDGRRLLELMRWMTALERFVANRGGADAPVAMFEQEAPINALLDGWEADATENRHRLESITRYVPEFSTLRAQVFSHLRTLRSQKALDLAAIERLVETVTGTLSKGDPKTLQSVLTDFETRYPRISGVQRLRGDLDRYLAIDAARNGENWIEARRLATKTAFQTPPFRDRVQAMLETELPSAAFVARYDSALDAWRRGQLAESLATLEALAREPWGAIAKRQLERNSRLKEDYAHLLTAKTSAGYEDQLLEFYKELNPEQDVYFVKALGDDMRLHSATALAEAQRAFADARTAWEKYRSSGGIGSLQRLEPGVSTTFRELARRLTQSYERITHGVGVYKLLSMNYPAEWDELNAQIVNEVRLQRRSLAELSMVLEPSSRTAKLDLLPVPPADQPQKGGQGPTAEQPQ